MIGSFPYKYLLILVPLKLYFINYRNELCFLSSLYLLYFRSDLNVL